ncbi:hypothetical protein DFH94DRAFT_310844 [Russula ochroleuca]|uniref:Uncharacterized protein n=1 Tax=Russula ochroleuca TaxID=152965 RepID=A0A9P5N0H1_9AGAM|nr:hypothetical protein DFH94DRAFT_310844 [Russula ochroleuca]
MGYVRSRTFCYCVPVRLGLLIMSILCCAGGSIMAGLGWDSALHKDETYLTQNQDVSVVIASFSYTVFAVISLFGLIGTIIKRRSFISLYNMVVWSHLALNIAAGAYFIHTLFHQVGEDDLSNCFYSYFDDNTSLDECEEEFQIYRVVIICVYIAFCLLELCVCLVVAGYVAQLGEEEAQDYPPPAQTAATIPPMATTYNYRRDYVFSQPAGQNKSIDV